MTSNTDERHIAAGQQGASLALLEEAFREGFSSSGTYNDVVEFSADECWDKKRDYFDGQARRLATPQPPQPAGCGACGDDCKDRGSCRLADESPKPAGAVPDPLDAAIAKGTKAWTGVPDSFVEDLRGEGAGRADAVPAGAVRKLVFAARTSGGTAGRDDALCAALDEVESLLEPLPQQPAADPMDTAIAAGLAGKLCEGCPPADYPTDGTRCGPCPRRSAPAPQPMTTQGEAVANHAECCAISGGDPARCDCVKPRHARIPSPEFEEWFRAIWGGSDDIPVPEYQSEGWNEYIAKRQLALGAWEAALTGSQP